MYQYKYFVANLDQQLMLEYNDLKILIEHIFPKFSLIFKTMEKIYRFQTSIYFFSVYYKKNKISENFNLYTHTHVLKPKSISGVLLLYIFSFH